MTIIHKETWWWKYKLFPSNTNIKTHLYREQSGEIKNSKIIPRRLLLGRKVVTNHSEGDQPWDFFGGNDAEAETPVLWSPHVKSLTHWERLWCWKMLRAGGEGDDRGWEHTHGQIFWIVKKYYYSIRKKKTKTVN